MTKPATPPEESKTNPWTWVALVVGLLVLVVLFRLAATQPPQKPPATPTFRPKPAPPLASYTPATPKLLALGKKMFLQHCALCHGKKGLGDGTGAAYLNPKPTPYIWGKFRYGNGFEDIMRILKKGSPNTSSGMVSWGWLPKQQREALASFVLDLSAKNAKQDTPSTSRKSKPHKPRTKAPPKGR